MKVLNAKKIIRKALTCFTLLVLFSCVIACNNTLQDKKEPDSVMEKTLVKEPVLHFTVNTLEELNKQNKARTVLPQTPELEKLCNFNLFVSSNTDSEYYFFETLEKLQTEEIVLPVKYTNKKVNFELTAYLQSVQGENPAEFSSKLNDVLIQSGDNTINFVLSLSKNLGDGKGNFTYTIDFSKATNKEHLNCIKATLLDGNEIYKLDDGTPVESTFKLKDFNNDTVTFACSNIPAGTYNVVIHFYNESEGKTVEISSPWREIIHIATALDSIKTLKIEKFNLNNVDLINSNFNVSILPDSDVTDDSSSIYYVTTEEIDGRTKLQFCLCGQEQVINSTYDIVWYLDGEIQKKYSGSRTFYLAYISENIVQTETYTVSVKFKAYDTDGNVRLYSYSAQVTVPYLT